MDKIDLKLITDELKKRRIKQAKGSVSEYPFCIDLDALTLLIGGNRYNLIAKACNYGGHRHYIECVSCGALSRCLYKTDTLFECGKCANAHEDTLNRTKTDCSYYWGLALKEARKIDANYKTQGFIFKHFPKKPKGMSTKKYAKHCVRFLYYLDKGDKRWIR